MASARPRSSSGVRRPRRTSGATDGVQSIHRGPQDRWLRTGAKRRSQSWEEVRRELHALRVPQRVISTLEGWRTSPEQGRSLARLIRDMMLANAYYRALQKVARWAAGTARDPHYGQSPENPGVLGPVRKLVDQVLADLKTLKDWRFSPPITVEELDANFTPTGRTMQLSQLDEDIRETFERARQELLGIQSALHDATQRPRGRKARLVKPFAVPVFSPARALPTRARRRELVRMLAEKIFVLHPDHTKHSRPARADAGRLARIIIDSIPLLTK